MRAISFDSDSSWLQFLLGHLPPQDEAAVLLAIDGGKPEIRAGIAKLICFYIDRARVAAEEGNVAASRTIEFVRERIKAQQPEKSVAETEVIADVSVVPPAPQRDDLEEISDAIRSVYRLTVRRNAVDEEVAIWANNFSNGLPFHQFVTLMESGEEAKRKRASELIGADLADGEFVLALFSLVSGRGCNGYELEAVRSRLETGGTTRLQLLAEFFSHALEDERRGADSVVHDGLSCSVMGTNRFVTLSEWQEKAKDSVALSQARAALKPCAPFAFRAEPRIEITAIASLFRGEDFIEQFMDNMTSQTCFDRHCELIIIDADSPENESEVISRYLSRHPSVRYRRMDTRVGIYEAWNIGVQMSRGQYLTNTNLDDLRRRDSLEIQAGVLQTLPFVDVVYQDFYYSFDPSLGWEDVAAFGYKSDLPIVTAHNMLRFNSPHNAPMWRKSLHDELGLFDGSFRSAGDYEFWLRCLAAGKAFYKVNEPHVVYYQNPKGLSTRADTRGVVEAKAIMKKYAGVLETGSFAGPLDRFVHDLHCNDIPDETIASRDRHIIAQAALRSLSARFRRGQN